MDVKILSDLIKEEVENRFDHKNLNLDVPEFQDLNPTAENIVVVIWNKLRKKIQADFDIEVILYETPRNFVTYRERMELKKGTASQILKRKTLMAMILTVRC
jgi:6-pyruvoyltetrahydropterin/6-carboxytetrahydropterin synthase